MSKTSIAWTDMTLNPIIGCTHAGYVDTDGVKRAHPGCTNCYAEVMCSRKLPGFEPHNRCSISGRWTGQIEVLYDRLIWPFTRPEYNPKRDGTQKRCFLTSLSDMGHPALPEADWMAINGMMVLAPWIRWQDLTKRPERQRDLLRAHSPIDCARAALKRIGELGLDTDGAVARLSRPLMAIQRQGWEDIYYVHRYVSVSDQPTADSLLPLLLEMPAAVRGISLEPMLGPVNLAFSAFNGADSFGQMPGIDHVIVGGESGRNARPFALEWALDIIDQCRRARVPCFVKQMGSKPYVEDPDFWPEFFSDDDGWYITGQGGNSWSKWVRMKGSGSDPAEWPEELRVRQHVLRQSVRAL